MEACWINPGVDGDGIRGLQGCTTGNEHIASRAIEAKGLPHHSTFCDTGSAGDGREGNTVHEGAIIAPDDVGGTSIRTPPGRHSGGRWCAARWLLGLRANCQKAHTQKKEKQCGILSKMASHCQSPFKA